MSHYICTGSCCGVSETPGACQAKECPKSGQELEECECEDGKHSGRQVHEHNHGRPENC